MSEKPCGHVVVCGLGTVGRQVMQKLYETGTPVVAVDVSPSARARSLAAAIGTRIVVGDARAKDVLDEAGLGQARAIVIATASDLVNLEVALLAEADDADVRIVLRMFSESIARQLEQEFPRWTVLSLPDLAAPTFVAAAVSPGVVRGWRVADRVLALAEVADERSGSLADFPEVTSVYVRRGGAIELWPSADQALAPDDRVGLVATLPQLQSMGGVLRHPEHLPRRWLRGVAAWPRRLAQGLTVLVHETEPAIRAVLAGALAFAALSVVVFSLFYNLSPLDSLYFVVTVITTIGFGDIHLRDAPAPLKMYGIMLMVVGAGVLMPTIYAFMTLYIVSARLRVLLGAIREDLTDHVVVVGLGTVGYRILDELRKLSPSVVAIDANENSRLVGTARGLGATVVHADARQIEALRLVNARRARAIVLATSDDLTNLEAALNAQRESPGIHVVLRLFDQSLAERVRGAFRLGASFSPAGLAAPVFAAAALGDRTLDRFPVDGHELLVARRQVAAGDPWEGWSVGELDARGHQRAIVLEAADGGTLIPPPRDHVLRAGEVLTVVAEADRWAQEADSGGGANCQ